MEKENLNPIPVLSVSGLIAALNQTLEYAYPSVEIEGEVASFKVNQNKFVFFDIKDESGSLGCFMTIWQLRMPIEDGMKVIIRATPKLTDWGKFSLTVQAIRPSGEGSLKKSYELLKAKLSAEGLFADERKRPLPIQPAHIGVISSTQAAGYADFIRIINERWGGMMVDVAHVQVQGETAPDQMIRAIKYFNNMENLPEFLVLIRGGGSADDLSCFNDEQLVREIAASRVPILVGVGHETDETLSDLAADQRAATPSHAAQMLVPDKQAIARSAGQSLVRTIVSLDRKINSVSEDIRRRLESAVGSVDASLQSVQQKLDNSRQVLSAYDPRAVLARGYAITRGNEAVGGTIIIEKVDKIITAEVSDVTKK